MRLDPLPGRDADSGARRFGAVVVSPRAIASVARRAAMESYGVVGLAGWLRRGLRQLFSLRRRKRLVQPGVEIDIVDRRVIIDLFVVVEYGTRISEVAANVASGVKFAVEQALGLPIVQVNVSIQRVRVSRVT